MKHQTVKALKMELKVLEFFALTLLVATSARKLANNS
jgi:hypothetical protein